jgi:hypothetical protein
MFHGRGEDQAEERRSKTGRETNGSYQFNQITIDDDTNSRNREKDNAIESV